MNAPVNHPVPLLELDILRTFVAIADTGSFTAAASIVFRTPSAVSMQIKKLEEMLGRPVFARDARSVSLTNDGVILLGYAKRLLSLNREAVSEFISPEISGVVRLGAPDDVGERILPDVLKRFARTHPKIAVDVVIDMSSSLIKRLQERRLDITLLTCQTDQVPEGGEVLLTEQLVWAGAKGGCAHLCSPIPVSMWEEGCAWRAGAVEELDARKISYRIADLAVAPLPKSFVGDDMVVLGEEDGLPPIGTYSLGMIVRPDAEAPVCAAADHIRATFETLRNMD